MIAERLACDSIEGRREMDMKREKKKDGALSFDFHFASR